MDTIQEISEELEAVADSVTGEAGGTGTFHYRIAGDESTHQRVAEVFDEYDADVEVQGDGEERSYYLDTDGR